MATKMAATCQFALLDTLTYLFSPNFYVLLTSNYCSCLNCLMKIVAKIDIPFHCRALSSPGCQSPTFLVYCCSYSVWGVLACSLFRNIVFNLTFLVLQSSLFERESCLLYYNCLLLCFFLSYVCYAFVPFCLFVPVVTCWERADHLALIVSLSLSLWYPGSGVVLDYIKF